MPLDVGLSLDRLKAQRKNAITQKRDQVEVGPIAYHGARYVTDDKAQIKIIGNLSALQFGKADSVLMIDADDIEQQFTQAEFIEFAFAVFAHVQTAYRTAQQLRQQIKAATTIAEVRAIDWPET